MISAKCIKWKITSFSASIPVHHLLLLCSKPPRTNLFCSKTTVHWSHFCPWQLRPMFLRSHTVSSESHNISSSSVPFARHTLRWIGHSRSFKVILIGVSRNPEWIVVIMYNNVDIISETYEDTASGKLQICRFLPWHFSLTTVIWETSNI